MAHPVSFCRSSSAVEYDLAKVGVAGSNPVFCSIILPGWRHWQTHRTEIPALRDHRTGPIPALGTIILIARPQLNWIEYLTTNQAVIGSAPIGRTIFRMNIIMNTGSSSAW